MRMRRMKVVLAGKNGAESGRKRADAAKSRDSVLTLLLSQRRKARECRERLRTLIRPVKPTSQLGITLIGRMHARTSLSLVSSFTDRIIVT